MRNLRVPVITIGLLTLTNVFMTFAWYGHLKFKAAPLFTMIQISWGIAFFEYALQVPANRIGPSEFSGAQLNTIQDGYPPVGLRSVLGALPERAAGREPYLRLWLHRLWCIFHL